MQILVRVPLLARGDASCQQNDCQQNETNSAGFYRQIHIGLPSKLPRRTRVVKKMCRLTTRGCPTSRVFCETWDSTGPVRILSISHNHSCQGLRSSLVLVYA